MPLKKIIMTKLERSNKAHLRLEKMNGKKAEKSKFGSRDEAKYSTLESYHKTCRYRQILTGKVLTKKERKALLDKKNDQFGVNWR